MKKLFVLMLAVSAIFFQGCEGPPGPEGPPGEPGSIFVSNAFELADVNFNSSNNYQVIEPYGFDTEPYDMTLVYILWEDFEGEDVWRLLPQQVYFQEGVLSYNFDFTRNDVKIFLETTMVQEDFDQIDASWTQNQVFRVVVVPADNVDARIDFSDYDAVMKKFGIEEEDFQKR